MNVTVKVHFQHVGAFQKLPETSSTYWTLALHFHFHPAQAIHQEIKCWDQLRPKKRKPIFTLNLLQSTEDWQNSLCWLNTSLVFALHSCSFLAHKYNSRNFSFKVHQISSYVNTIYAFSAAFVASPAFECIHTASEYTKEGSYESLVRRKPFIFTFMKGFSYHHRKK